MWQRAKKAVEEPAEEEEQEEVVDTTGMTALQAWAAKQRVARRAAAKKSAAPARRPRKVGSPCYIHYFQAVLPSLIPVLFRQCLLFVTEENIRFFR
jgi:hypothetical protein